MNLKINKIIDESTNELSYKILGKPIIYSSDIYIKEIKASKKIKKDFKIHLATNQLFCTNIEYNGYMFSKLKKKFGIKENSILEIEKIILKKKIGYSDIL